MTTRKLAVDIFKVILIGILAVTAAGIFIENDRYEHTNNVNSAEYKSHKAKYQPIIKKRDNDLKLLIADLENGSITSQEYIAGYTAAQNKAKTDLKAYTKTKNELQSKYKYLGWNGFYYFRLKIDPYITIFIMGLFLLYVIFNPITAKWKKIVFSVFSGIFLFTSSFIIIQTIFAKRGDFSEKTYLTLLTWIPIIVALLLPLLFYHYTTIETKLKNSINLLITKLIKTNDKIENDNKRKEDFK